MSNKETLQEYNTKLIANNDSLQTVMDMINNLPEAGGSADILLQDKSIEITENGTTNIVADEGYDGLNNVEVVTNVSGGEELTEIYSTEEVKTNKTWIDGKPIYRKVFTGTLPTAASYSTYVSLYFDISDTNYDTPVDIYGSIDQADGFAFWSLNWYNHVAGASAITNINNDTSNKIQVRHNCNWLSDQPVFVVFEYTKTTD